MWKHALEEHNDDKENVKFNMKKMGSYSKPLRRQISESISIKNTKTEENLNSKAEFHGPAVRRRYVEGSELQCDKCDYKPKTLHTLTKHKQLKHTVQLNDCIEREHDITPPDNLTNHRNTKHGARITECRQYCCDKCDYKCKTMNTLKNHKQLIHRMRPGDHDPTENLKATHPNKSENHLIHLPGNNDQSKHQPDT